MEYSVSKNEKVLEALYNLRECIVDKGQIVENNYHHNANYKDLISILKYGILSFNKKLELGLINKLPMAELVQPDGKVYVLPLDIANGYDYISIAELMEYHRPNRFIYGPYDPAYVDIIVSTTLGKKRFVGHNCQNYENELNVKDMIEREFFESINIRFHGLSNLIEKYNYLQNFIDDYNHLISSAEYMQKEGILIPIKEVIGTDTYTLATEKVKELKRI